MRSSTSSTCAPSRIQNGDGDRRFPGAGGKARLPGGSRRHRHLAAAVLSFAAAGRRLRYLRLQEFHPFLRHPEGLQVFPARSPCSRAAGDYRAGAEPHLRPASLVSGGPRRDRPGSPAPRISTSGATRPRNTRKPASSSRTSSPPTGPGTRWPTPTTGTGSTPISPT